MSQFSFNCYNSGRNTAVEFEAEHIDEVIENFEQFLRGCGYYFHGQIVRYDDEPELADKIRESVVSQPCATDQLDLGAYHYDINDAYTGERADINITYAPPFEGHDW